jgi:hypothetical protein
MVDVPISGGFASDTRVSDFAQVAAMAASIHVKASYDDQGQLLPAQVNACFSSRPSARVQWPPLPWSTDRPGDRWPRIEAFAPTVCSPPSALTAPDCGMIQKTS